MNFQKLCELLCCPSPDPIYEGDTDAEVVEEIIRREGTFYTGPEAKNIIPWRLTGTNTCIAKIKYLPGEKKPVNPGFAECNWIVLSPIQYMYGTYLQQQISDGIITIEDIVNKRPGRKSIEP